MSDFNRRDLRGWLMREIEDHLARTNETAGQFGRKLDNARLIRQFLDGASPRLDTVQKLLDHIDGIT